MAKYCGRFYVHFFKTIISGAIVLLQNLLRSVTVFGFGTVGFSLREVVSAQEVLDETPKSKCMLPGCKSAQQSFAFLGTLSSLIISGS